MDTCVIPFRMGGNDGWISESCVPIADPTTDFIRPSGRTKIIKLRERHDHAHTYTQEREKGIPWYGMGRAGLG
jgi:hypothetical protein